MGWRIFSVWLPDNSVLDALMRKHLKMFNLTPKVMRECLKASASILPSISKASKEARMTSSS